LLRLARYLTPSQSAAEDLVQATLLSAIEHIDSWEGRGPLKHWLIRILTHRNRRQARNRELPADSATWEQLAAAAGWSADANLNRSEQISQVQQALLRLDEPDREVLLLRDVEGIEGNEAAGILGLSLAAMKSRLHRARLRLLAAVQEVSVLPLSIGSHDSMTCMEVLQCLGDYADGGLDSPAVSAIHAHLSHCDRCRLFSQRYARLLDQLPTLPAIAQAPE
jgi:RNA polymerase sigma-70 factor (ECF subfamily)